MKRILQLADDVRNHKAWVAHVGPSSLPTDPDWEVPAADDNAQAFHDMIQQLGTGFENLMASKPGGNDQMTVRQLAEKLFRG